MAHLYLRVCAALIVLRSFTNFGKLFRDDAIIVVFGQILHGSAVTVPAVVIGILMLVTGIAMWTGSKWALPLIAIYAAYVFFNLIAWTMTNPQEFERVGGMVSAAGDADSLRQRGYLAFLGYSVVALATTAVPAWLLWQRRS